MKPQCQTIDGLFQKSPPLKGGSYINVPSIVVSIHFKSCVRQCSSNNPLPSMRPDNTREILKALLASKARAGRNVSQPGLVKLSQ